MRNSGTLVIEMPSVLAEDCRVIWRLPETFCLTETTSKDRSGHGEAAPDCATAEATRAGRRRRALLRDPIVIGCLVSGMLILYG
jgi:hypothetical protein